MRNTLASGLAQLDLPLNDAQQQQLLDYVALLFKWNKVYNLTAVREPQRMISRHLLDSLAVLRYLQGVTLLDIGSGAGLPGIPLAIARPELHCTLLDSNCKKTRFMQQVKAELQLHNIVVKQARISEHVMSAVDTVISRAFSSPVDIIATAGRLCSPDGVLLFMLGHTDKLLDDFPPAYELTQLESVTVPFESGVRHVAVCRHRRE